MSDDKRLEKLLKRAKPFLDEKLKAKQRLNSLYSFMENSTEQDQTKFYEEHDYQIYQVMFDCFTHQVEKIKSREKPDKPLTVTGKEVTDLFRILHILKRIAVLLPLKIRSGWQRRSIVGILQTMLASTNHPKLRIEGFRILLLYLTPQTTESHEVTPIYANAIPLSVFDVGVCPVPIDTAAPYCADSERKDAVDAQDEGTWKGEGKGALRQEAIEWERRVTTLVGTSVGGVSAGNSCMDKTALLPSMTPFTSYDSVDLFEEILQHLVQVASLEPIPPPRKSSRQNSASATCPLPSSGDPTALSEYVLAPEPDSIISGDGVKNMSSEHQFELDEEDEMGIREEMAPTPVVTSVMSEVEGTERSDRSGIVSDPVAAPTALAVMWGYFKKYYLKILFPRVSKKCGMEVVDGEGFATCPPQLLHCLINFLIRQCVDTPVSQASVALRTLLLGSDYSNLEMVHEWLRQAMLLPIAWSDVLRGSIGVVRVWLGQAEEERPPFLQQRVGGRSQTIIDAPDLGNINAYARRYIRYMRLLFSNKVDDVEHMEAQHSIFHEALSLYRTLTSESHSWLSAQTWRTLTSTLLDITSHVLGDHAHPPAILKSDAILASGLADYIFETVFTTWVRSGIQDDEMWKTLRDVLERCLGWKECVAQWEVITLELTSIMAEKTYGKELDTRFVRKPRPMSASSGSGGTDRSNSILTAGAARMDPRRLVPTPAPSVGLKGAKSETDISQLQGGSATTTSTATVTTSSVGKHSPVTSQASEGRPWGLEFFKHKEPSDVKAVPLNEGIDDTEDDPLVLTKKVSGVALVGHGKSSSQSLFSLLTDAHESPAHIPTLALRRAAGSAEFGDIRVLSDWTAESALFAWENVLCVLGDLNNITAPPNHAEAMRCTKKVWDALEYIRLSQPYESQEDMWMPPLFKFASWWFKAADLDSNRADGRAVAVGCMCRMMCRRHDQPFPETYYAHFYRLLVKGLASDDIQVITAIMGSCKKLFTHGLSGSYILIEPFLTCIRKLFASNGSFTTFDLPEDVRQDAITILSALVCVPNHFISTHTTPAPPPSMRPSRVLSTDGMHVAGALRAATGSKRDSNRPHSISTSYPPAVPTPSPAARAAAARRSSELLANLPLSPARRTASPPASPGGLVPAIRIDDSATRSVSLPPSPTVYRQSEQLGEEPPTRVDLKAAIKETFLALLQEERQPARQDLHPETFAMLHWGLTVMAFDEMMNAPRPTNHVVDDCINSLLDHLTVDSVQVVHAAADGLTFLAQNHTLLPYIDMQVLQGIVEKVVGALNEQLLLHRGSSNPQVCAYIIKRLLYCLLDWTMILPQEVWAISKVSQMVFEVIENAMSVPADVETAMSPSAEPEKGNTLSRRARASIYESSGLAPPVLSLPTNVGTRDRRSTSESRNSTSDRADSNLPATGRPGSVNAKLSGDEDGGTGSQLIRETAENVLMHILHHVNNFAPPHGASMLSSQILDPALQDEPKEGEKYLYLAINGTTIMTIVDMPGRTPLDSRARLIVRDMTGRYTWDSRLFYESLLKMQKRAETLGNGSNDNLDRFRHDPCQYQGIVAALEIPGDVTVEEQPRILKPDPVTYSRAQGAMPTWQSGIGAETADMLDELLRYIGTAHPDCLLKKDVPLNVSSPVHSSMVPAVLETREALQRQIKAEQHFINAAPSEAPAASRRGSHMHNSTDTLAQKNISPGDSDTETTEEDVNGAYLHPSSTLQPMNTDAAAAALRRRATVPHVQMTLLPYGSQRLHNEGDPTEDLKPVKGYAHVKPLSHPRKAPPFQRARLLLSHSGNIDFDSLKAGHVHLLAETPALYRDIKVLDRKHGRETVKLAVMYVAPGQEDEQSIFRNSRGSLEYQEFVASLGWEVDLTTHPGFLGGLEKSLANGNSATYYCTSTYEMLFHDVTKMPVDPDDEKQLKKKRHIGNDHVHIIWNEHYREYRQGTIGGDFGNAQLIVTPRTDGLFSVDVIRDDKVPSFGPLHGHTVVTRRILGPLVRQTALNAYRAALAIGDPMQMKHHHPTNRHHVPQTRHAFTARREDITTIAERHKVGKWTFEKFLDAVFPSENPFPVPPVPPITVSQPGSVEPTGLARVASGIAC
ncbi:Ral GTPase-activating protein subunit alpha-2 [Thoreauomyces humboldtii]|nr:Ral GTPase-activating protein subunit alpha-2 [Thoreauomyces humboldtii]